MEHMKLIAMLTCLMSLASAEQIPFEDDDKTHVDIDADFGMPYIAESRSRRHIDEIGDEVSVCFLNYFLESAALSFSFLLVAETKARNATCYRIDGTMSRRA